MRLAGGQLLEKNLQRFRAARKTAAARVFNVNKEARTLMDKRKIVAKLVTAANLLDQARGELGRIEAPVDDPSPAETALTKEPGPSPIEIIGPGPSPISAEIPYFDIGDATGAPGETVEVPVEAGCLEDVTGFHIGGGVGLDIDEERSGYGKFRAVGAKLGPYFQRYLRAEDAKLHDQLDEVGEHYFSKFNFLSARPHRALPEEWWEFLVGLLSIEHRTMLGTIKIPFGTHLFTLMIEIHASTPPGEYELTCKDQCYFTHSRRRRRKFEFTNERQGFTKIETFGGLLKVT